MLGRILDWDAEHYVWCMTAIIGLACVAMVSVIAYESGYADRHGGLVSSEMVEKKFVPSQQSVGLGVGSDGGTTTIPTVEPAKHMVLMLETYGDGTRRERWTEVAPSTWANLEVPGR